jgi:uncharacterized protein YaaN involved in tellurite resistance
MHPRTPRGRILPKISTMPRRASEASSYLDLYKLVIEKDRLQQELETIEHRKVQIHERLETLTQQIDGLKAKAEELGQSTTPASLRDSSSAQESSQANGGDYKTVYLDY